MQTKSDRYAVAFLWIVFGILGRIIPHPPNLNPMTSVALFGGAQLGRGRAFVVTLLTLMVSDILIAWAGGHEIFGLWSLFTYTGFAAIILAGRFLRTVPTAGRTLGFLTGSSVFFWVWTNFGMWLTSGVYALNSAGLLACFVAAIPFLGNALIGDLAWGLLLFLSFYGVRRVAPRFGLAVQGA